MNRKYKDMDYYLRLSFIDSMNRTQGSLGSPLRRPQAAPYFSSEEMLLKKKVRPKRIRRLANDNFKRVRAKRNFRKISLTVFVIAGFLLLSLIALNHASVSTYIVMETNDQVLSVATDINADAVATVLNDMNIGE